MNPFTVVHDVLAAFGAGKFVLIVDEDRENEGDITLGAQFATAASINFLATFARGLICVPMIGPRLDELHIPLMVPADLRNDAAAFTVSVDARSGVTTGISARDRARTVQVLIDRDTRPEDLVMPGHTFPLRYREGGVLCRPGHTEAAVDLARLAGLYPAAVICEVMNEDGTMATPTQLTAVARRHRMPVLTLQQLVEYRQRTEVATGVAAPPRRRR